MTDKKLTEGTTAVDYEGTLKSLTKQYYDVLDLINRLQAENEGLTNNVISLTRSISELTDEVERQRKDKENSFEVAANIIDAEKTVIAETKAESYKEFAERLKKEQYLSIVDMVVSVTAIDNLLKELVGDDNA